MHFASQSQYEQYHSPEARRQRTEAARRVTDEAVSAAFNLFRQGDIAGAEMCLFDAGLSPEGISHYLTSWREP